MTDTSEWDPTGEVTAELRSAVEIYGERALSSKQVLENFFSDPFPKGNKGANLLVSGAEAGVAASLRRHLEEGLDPDNAVLLTGREFEDTRPVPAGSGLWVASQMAGVLGIPASDRLAERATRPQPVVTPVGPPVGPDPEAPVHQPQALTPPIDRSAVGGNGQTGPDRDELRTIGVTDPTQPPRPPTGPSGPPGGGAGRNRTPIIAAGIVAALAILYIVVAATAHIVPFSKSTSTTVSLPPPPPRRRQRRRPLLRLRRRTGRSPT